MPLPVLLACLVIGVTDGDTLKVRCGTPGAYQQMTVRLAAIDAPERRQPYGNVSRQRLAALCFQELAAISPRTQDRYGRLVGDVSCKDRDAGADLVGSGMAWVYDRYALGSDADLKRLQASAQRSKTGLWSQESPVAPWLWRREQRKSQAM